MPENPLPEEPDDSARSSREIFMRWQQRHDFDVEPVLLEISVGAGWASTDLGRHLLAGIVDVDLEAPDDIVENVTPDPSGTPVVMGAGQHVLLTCQYGGALFDE